jgi:hypothetical protein
MRFVPKRLTPVAVSIESLLGISTMSIEEIIDSLKNS